MQSDNSFHSDAAISINEMLKELNIDDNLVFENEYSEQLSSTKNEFQQPSTKEKSQFATRTNYFLEKPEISDKDIDFSLDEISVKKENPHHFSSSQYPSSSYFPSSSSSSHYPSIKMSHHNSTAFFTLEFIDSFKMANEKIKAMEAQKNREFHKSISASYNSAEQEDILSAELYSEIENEKSFQSVLEKSNRRLCEMLQVA